MAGKLAAGYSEVEETEARETEAEESAAEALEEGDLEVGVKATEARRKTESVEPMLR